VEIAVQGQLDEDELQAIGDLVQKVDALASQFFGGDMEAAFSAAADLGFDGSEIASFSLRMSLKESVGVRIPVQPSPAPAVAPTDQAQAVAGEALAQSSDPASSVPDAVPVEPIAAPLVEAADEPAAVETPEATSPAAEQAPAGQGSDVPSLQEILGSYLQQVMGSLADIGSAGRVELSMSWKMRLMAAALEVPTQPAGQTPGAALLGESLQSAAAARA
jgi:hypothetical protein